MNFDKQLDVFSRNLSEIRRNGRYSYQAFSEKLRVGKSTVQAIESGGYNITLSTLITIANSLEIHPALLLMDLPIELDLTGTNRYYANLLMTYSALPEEQRSQFRNMIQRLECSLDGDHLEQNDTGVKWKLQPACASLDSQATMWGFPTLPAPSHWCRPSRSTYIRYSNVFIPPLPQRFKPRQPVWSGTYAPCSAHTGAPAASHYCRPSLRVRLPPVPRSVS